MANVQGRFRRDGSDTKSVVRHDGGTSRDDGEGRVCGPAGGGGRDGVHLGQKDLPCREARRILGRHAIIGVSAALPDEAAQAEADGADYLGVGAVFSTSTKSDTRHVTPEIIRQIRAAATIPFVVIGGVNKENILSLKGLGINGAAVVSAVAAQKDITAAAREMRAAAAQL